MPTNGMDRLLAPRASLQRPPAQHPEKQSVDTTRWSLVSIGIDIGKEFLKRWQI